jgi:hypothetical protein
VLQYSPRDHWICDRGNQPHPLSAAWAAKGINLEDSLEQLGPRVAARGTGEDGTNTGYGTPAAPIKLPFRNVR